MILYQQLPYPEIKPLSNLPHWLHPTLYLLLLLLIHHSFLFPFPRQLSPPTKIPLPLIYQFYQRRPLSSLSLLVLPSPLSTKMPPPENGSILCLQIRRRKCLLPLINLPSYLLPRAGLESPLITPVLFLPSLPLLLPLVRLLPVLSAMTGSSARCRLPIAHPFLLPMPT